jgi:hypothetical protein
MRPHHTAAADHPVNRQRRSRCPERRPHFYLRTLGWCVMAVGIVLNAALLFSVVGTVE